MKNRLYIISSISVVLVAAVFIYSFGHFLHSQRLLNRGLWNACTRDNAAAASYWLAKGASVNARDDHGAVAVRKGQTALHMCAHFGNPKTAELLLLVGADPNAADVSGSTPLYYCNFGAVADLLVSYGANVNHEDRNGDTALQARQKNGWHLDAELKAVLEGDGPSARLRREFETQSAEPKGDFVKNSDGHGTAWVWDIYFDVAEPVGGSAGSKYSGTSSGAFPENNKGQMTFNVGSDVNIRLQRVPGRPVLFELNDQTYGTLDPGDKVVIDKERSVTVNGTVRKPAVTGR